MDAATNIQKTALELRTNTLISAEEAEKRAKLIAQSAKNELNS